MRRGAHLGTVIGNIRLWEICLGTSAPPPAPDMTAMHQAAVEFPDNKLLIDLCGEYDRNLAKIEQQLGVQIIRRGNHLQILGEGEAVEKAESLLNALYVRLESGRAVEPADVDGLLRMGNSGAGTGVRQGDGVSLIVDMTAGFIEVHVMRFVPEAGKIVPKSVAKIALDRTAQEAPAPVALAVSLKYAGDYVRVNGVDVQR